MGDASVRIGGVEERATQKNLGLIVHNSLRWTSQDKFRSGKSVKALHLIRRNTCDSANSYTRLNPYKGEILPILSYRAFFGNFIKRPIIY